MRRKLSLDHEKAESSRPRSSGRLSDLPTRGGEPDPPNLLPKLVSWPDERPRSIASSREEALAHASDLLEGGEGEGAHGARQLQAMARRGLTGR